MDILHMVNALCIGVNGACCMFFLMRGMRGWAIGCGLTGVYNFGVVALAIAHVW